MANDPRFPDNAQELFGSRYDEIRQLYDETQLLPWMTCDEANQIYGYYQDLRARIIAEGGNIDDEICQDQTQNVMSFVIPEDLLDTRAVPRGLVPMAQLIRHGRDPVERMSGLNTFKRQAKAYQALESRRQTSVTYSPRSSRVMRLCRLGIVTTLQATDAGEDSPADRGEFRMVIITAEAQFPLYIATEEQVVNGDAKVDEDSVDERDRIPVSVLASHVRLRNEDGLAARLHVCLCVAEAVLEIHECNLLHLNVNSESVTVSKSLNQVVLGNLNDTYVASEATAAVFSTGTVANVNERAPELLNPDKTARISRAVDVFCFGVMLDELFCSNNGGVWERECQAILTQLGELRDLCMAEAPLDRPPMQTVMNLLGEVLWTAPRVLAPDAAQELCLRPVSRWAYTREAMEQTFALVHQYVQELERTPPSNSLMQALRTVCLGVERFRRNVYRFFVQYQCGYGLSLEQLNEFLGPHVALVAAKMVAEKACCALALLQFGYQGDHTSASFEELLVLLRSHEANAARSDYRKIVKSFEELRKYGDAHSYGSEEEPRARYRALSLASVVTMTQCIEKILHELTQRLQEMFGLSADQVQLPDMNNGQRRFLVIANVTPEHLDCQELWQALQNCDLFYNADICYRREDEDSFTVFIRYAMWNPGLPQLPEYTLDQMLGAAAVHVPENLRGLIATLSEPEDCIPGALGTLYSVSAHASISGLSVLDGDA